MYIFPTEKKEDFRSAKLDWHRVSNMQTMDKMSGCEHGVTWLLAALLTDGSSSNHY